jgi:putative glutamine transport system substrate-binding protein
MGRWRRGSLVAAIMVAFLLSGCAGKQVPGSVPSQPLRVLDTNGVAQQLRDLGASLDSIRKRGTLRIIVQGYDPPFSTISAENSKAEGFAIDVGRRITEIVFGGGVKAEFSTEITHTGVLFRTADMELTRRQITDHPESFRISQPYYTDSMRFLVRRDQGFSTTQDLVGKSVGYSHFYTRTPDPERSTDVKQRQITAALTLKQFGDVPAAVYHLRQDNIAAVMLPTSEVFQGFDESNEFAVLPERYESWSYGAIMSDKSTELADAVDKAIRQMTDSGELTKLVKKWGLDI